MPAASPLLSRPSLRVGLIGLCISLFLASCIVDPLGKNVAETKTQVLSNREIVDSSGASDDESLYQAPSHGFRIRPGDQDLFEYYHKEADVEGIADDEFAESFYFVVPPGTENLAINDSTGFAAHRARYAQYCFCPLSYGVVDSGSLVVTRTGNGRYSVTADIGYELRYLDFVVVDTFPNTERGYTHTERGRLKFSRTFRKK